MNDKKNFPVILLWGLMLVSLLLPGIGAAAPQTGHPYMLFHDISDAPGYQYRTIAPWKSWESGILSSADQSLSRTFSGSLGSYDRVNYRGGFAEYLGLAYQITKKSQYAQKGREALLNLDVGTVSGKTDRALALGSYSLAYDFIQPSLDPATDATIRDKLATLADTVYKDLNDNGTNLKYVTFADYHGQAYPMVGVAGAALSDYTNPHKLPLSSTPADWNKVGTVYLFENDQLHTSGRSLFSYGFEEASGKNFLGAYKSYVTEDYSLWLQVAYHTYGENLLEKYPAVKKAFTSELWESLPNSYSNNFVTSGNTKWAYHTGIISLLSDTEKGQILNHLDRVAGSKILPYSTTMGGSPSGALQYCVYGNYASIPRTFPATTSHLDPKSIYQVFRENWNDDADWLSLITWNKPGDSNRDMRHNDQLAFEYYSRGDLLLADAGEPKYTSSYGEYDIHHNTIALEDPRTPFKQTPISGSTSAGIFKGTDYSFATPATVNTLIQVPWMQLLQSNVSVKTVMAGGYGVSQTLSNPVQYERTIVYPDTDYFLVVDRFESTQPWVYRNIFRPTSLMVTPTVDANKDGKYTGEIGHVNGNLVIGSTSYNWLPLSPKTETRTGITTNSLTWTTKNPYGKDVRLNLFSAPSSEILIEKNTGRIGGYSAESEVYSPVVYFRTPAASSEYRVTALLSSYADEVPKSATEIPVTGTGHAVKVSSASSDDYIYTGKGTSSFAGYSTDADTAFIRNAGSNNEFSFINGASLKKNTSTTVSISKKLDYFTLKREGNEIKFRIKGDSSGYITLNNIVGTRVLRDGVVYNDWVSDQNAKTLTISTTLTEHEFEISSEDYLIIDPVSRQTVNINEHLVVPLSVTYTGTGKLQATASNLPQYSTFNATPRTFSWTPNENQVGKYSVTFLVTDGRMSDSCTMLITVKEENQAPVFEDMENKTVIVHSTLQFAINATDADGDVLTYSASDLPRNATFDPATRTFSWTPDTNQAGKFIVVFKVTDGLQGDSSTVLITVKELSRDPLLNRAPVFEDIENKSVIVRSTLQFAINATDADGDILTYSSCELPKNATFHPANHTFVWTPADGQTGSFNVTFMVSDGLLSDNQSVQIRVRESTNNAPVFGAIADVSVNQKETLTVNVTASDPDGDTLTYSASRLPSGSKFSPETRKFTWSPASNQTGNYTVTFRVTDGIATTSRNVTFTAVKVNYPPYFPSGNYTTKTVNAGTTIQLNIIAADWNEDAITYTATNLPTGATVDSETHTFSWTPGYDQAGTYDITLIISDGQLQARALLNIIVINNNNVSNKAPVIGAIADASVNQKELVHVRVTASDPDGDPLTYSASNLPSGATFDPATRLFTWMPAYTQAGNYVVTFRVTDGTVSVSRSVTFTAIKVNYAPYFPLGNFTAKTVNEGATIRLNIVAGDWNHDVITYSGKNLPKGATVDSATHRFSWTPGYDQAGTYDITLVTSDGKLLTSKLLRITVIDTMTSSQNAVFIKLE